MPDKHGNDLTDEDETPETPLHAHDEGREEDVVGNPEPQVGEEGDLDEGPAANPVADEPEHDDDEQ